MSISISRILPQDALAGRADAPVLLRRIEPVGADNVATAVNLVFSCRTLEREVRYLAAGEAGAGRWYWRWPGTTRAEDTATFTVS